jgi:N-acetylglutamate synthase-like GNAT family acetyltransferase
MLSAAYRVRRATVEDLEVLRALWAAMKLPADELKNRLTEFQIATDAAGRVVGAIGFQFAGRQGLIHSEAFADFAVADQVRPLFWARIQALATNHGVARLWTRETAPFWSHNGLQPAGRDALGRLPEAWNRAAAGWLTLRLKDEDVLLNLDKEFALFKEAEKRHTAATLGQARKLKLVFTVLGILVSAALLAAALYLLLARRAPGSIPP